MMSDMCSLCYAYIYICEMINTKTYNKSTTIDTDEKKLMNKHYNIIIIMNMLFKKMKDII